MIPSLNNQDSIEKGFLFFWLYLDIETLGGGFKDFYVHPYFGEMIQFDEHIFQVGWFNHQLETAMYERLFVHFHGQIQHQRVMRCRWSVFVSGCWCVAEGSQI